MRTENQICYRKRPGKKHYRQRKTGRVKNHPGNLPGCKSGFLHYQLSCIPQRRLGIPGRNASGRDRQQNKMVVLAQCIYAGNGQPAAEKMEAGNPASHLPAALLRHSFHTSWIIRCPAVPGAAGRSAVRPGKRPPVRRSRCSPQGQTPQSPLPSVQTEWQ